MKYLKSFLLTIGLFLLETLIISFLLPILGLELSSLIGSIIFIVIFSIIKYKDLKEDLCKIKFDKKVLIASILLTFISIVLHYIFLNILKEDATNNAALAVSLKKAPIIYGLYVGIFAPIAEELIFRYPYKNINNKISLVINTLVFASIHLLGSTSLIACSYFIIYLIVSFSVSINFYKNQNIFTSMAYHIFNNLINIVILLI